MRDAVLRRANQLESWLERSKGQLALMPLRLAGLVGLALLLLITNLIAVATWPLRLLHRAPPSPDLADGKLHDVDHAGLQAAVAGPTPVLIDFWAPWCGPCVMMEPALKTVAGELEGQLAIVRVSCTQHEQIAREYGARALPTLVLLHDGTELERRAAALSTGELRSWLGSHLKHLP
jgi:thioredoxin